VTTGSLPEGSHHRETSQLIVEPVLVDPEYIYVICWLGGLHSEKLTKVLKMLPSARGLGQHFQA